MTFAERVVLSPCVPIAKYAICREKGGIHYLNHARVTKTDKTSTIKKLPRNPKETCTIIVDYVQNDVEKTKKTMKIKYNRMKKAFDWLKANNKYFREDPDIVFDASKGAEYK